MSEPATPTGGTSAGSRRPSTGLLITGGVVLLLVAGVAGGLIGRASASSGTAGDATCAATTIADDVLPSVVTVHVSNGATAGNGSGEVIQDGGYVLTNDHV